MIIDDARLTAYLEGQLDALGQAEIESALAADSLLMARLARLRARQSRQVEPTAEEAIPERLQASAGANGRDNIVRLADRLRPMPSSKPAIQIRWPSWGGLAAMLGLGLVLGYAAAHQGSGPLALRGDGVLTVRGDLVRVLNTVRSGEPGATRIGLSFKTPDGRYCRVFQMDSARLAGVACREGPGWVVRMSATPPANTGGRAAASNTPLSVLGAVDGMMAGRPLDEAAEVRAMSHNWKD
jgi:hypothetical protein